MELFTKDWIYTFPLKCFITKYKKKYILKYIYVKF